MPLSSGDIDKLALEFYKWVLPRVEEERSDISFSKKQIVAIRNVAQRAPDSPLISHYEAEPEPPFELTTEQLLPLGKQAVGVARIAERNLAMDIQEILPTKASKMVAKHYLEEEGSFEGELGERGFVEVKIQNPKDTVEVLHAVTFNFLMNTVKSLAYHNENRSDKDINPSDVRLAKAIFIDALDKTIKEDEENEKLHNINSKETKDN